MFILNLPDILWDYSVFSKSYYSVADLKGLWTMSNYYDRFICKIAKVFEQFFSVSASRELVASSRISTGLSEKTALAIAIR